MDVREKLVAIVEKASERTLPKNTCHTNIVMLVNALIEEGVTVQKWISVKERTPAEADGTVWVYLADVFPYNEKEPYIDAKHDRRITEAFYSQFSKRWYKDGAVFSDGIVTHWMEKPQPPKGE